MTEINQIRQQIDNVVAQIADLENQKSEQSSGSLKNKVTQKGVLVEQGTTTDDKTGNLVDYKKWRFPATTIGRFEWKEHDVTVYSSGSVWCDYKYKNNSLFTKCFITYTAVIKDGSEKVLDSFMDATEVRGKKTEEFSHFNAQDPYVYAKSGSVERVIVACNDCEGSKHQTVP